MLQGFGYLGLHRLDRNPHFPGNFLISLPFLPTFAINLPTFVWKGTNSFFNQSIHVSLCRFMSLYPKYQQQEHIHILLLPRWEPYPFHRVKHSGNDYVQTGKDKP